MALKRDGLLPGALGRPQGLQPGSRTASTESLTAHPLLSPSHPVSVTSSSEAGSTHSPPRYVPYTPRQRTAPTATATSGTTTMQSSASVSVSVPAQQHTGDARTKLQHMNMKAAAQSIGLDTGSVGWAILEKLSTEAEHGAEWNHIWEAVTAGKATLLLPKEQLSGQSAITAEFIKDHIAFYEGPSRDNAAIVTLSGLRGVIQQEVFTLRSALLPSSKPFQALSSPSTRAFAFAALPPLPAFPPNTYPTFAVPSHTPSLPLPPRPGKPPLPPRPGARSTPLQASRLGNPFSHLFGSKPSTPSSPAPSTVSLPPTEGEYDHTGVEVSAFALDRRIVRKDVGRAIVKAIKAEMKAALAAANVPAWVIERTQNFSYGLYPLVRAPKNGNAAQDSAGYIVNPEQDTAEELARMTQDFYALLEEDLRAGGSPTIGRRREDAVIEDEKDKMKRAGEKTPSGARIREIMEVVEGTIATTFFDRLFSPLTSDDASHDEALSSRVAALNLVDLGLEHLGVDVGKSATEVSLVVKACGEMLTQLAACRTPADKAAILVASHKMVVDGLSRLPPVRLKSDAEIKDQATPTSSRSRQNSLKAEGKPDSELQAAETKLDETSAQDDNVPEPSEPLLVSLPQSIPAVLLSPVDVPSTTSDNRSFTSTSDTSSLRPRAASPLLTISPPPEREPTTVSGDVLLPMIIFATVKANPPHLVSHLLFIQRFRNQSVGGEESYCLCNLLAVAEFLENVDLAALGLGDSSQKVMSAADLTPIPVAPTVAQVVPTGLRGRVDQQLDAIAGTATKALSGVVDSSFGVLRSLLPGTSEGAATPIPSDEQQAAPWNGVRPGFGLLRRESGFSIASLAASLPVNMGRERSRSVHKGPVEEGGQQMTEVSSRPGSRASRHSIYVPNSDEEDSDEEGEDDEKDEGEDSDQDEDADEVANPDSRSIRSFESMLSSSRPKGQSRKSLSDRLASMPGLGRITQHALDSSKASPPSSRRSSLLPPPPVPNRFDAPTTSRPHSPSAGRLPPPNAKFMQCSAEDLRLSEVSELLQEYKRLVESVRAIGGFEDS
ncbi:hypothetical protein PUNSTDRAFT_67044 [Punctularia strigosozonata HHB-11173 SS5]|uniref:uncharacterized protein n=1 Tax=Punctularia strigosozonata (strain HHB-11173) TaxID=741275 RepID=UPI0004416548|nr:uncharacterized protein PUNSTDRAFT_67044 [Punctularia strigosozonata HHB-11173 SS5]EIN09471.1 hypothetical protein PUNSTDRAFT_67044 [Punctularia strigosozonata HHB-11173 SS5]